jgi:hypothetical protein
MKKAYPILGLGLLALGFGLVAQKNLGTGYELENVEVMDPKMRLADARTYMIQFNEALNMQCRDCHDLRDFASDDNELKLVAREMMKMELEINERWFPDSEVPVVTCFTCHQGQRIPARSSLLPALHPGLGE